MINDFKLKNQKTKTPLSELRTKATSQDDVSRESNPKPQRKSKFYTQSRNSSHRHFFSQQVTFQKCTKKFMSEDSQSSDETEVPLNNIVKTPTEARHKNSFHVFYGKSVNRPKKSKILNPLTVSKIKGMVNKFNCNSQKFSLKLSNNPLKSVSPSRLDSIALPTCLEREELPASPAFGHRKVTIELKRIPVLA